MGPVEGHRGDELRLGSGNAVAIFGASCFLGRAACRPLVGSLAADDYSCGWRAADGSRRGLGGARASCGCFSACLGGRGSLRASRCERRGGASADQVV